MDPTARIAIEAKNQLRGPVNAAVKDMKKLSGEAKKVGKSVGQSFTNAGKSISDFSSKTRAISLGATAALVGAGQASIQFERNLSNISTLITGDSAPAIAALKEGIRDTATEFGVAHNELATSAYSIYSAGITDTTKAQEALTEATRLSIAGLGSSEQATDLLTSSLNAFASQNLTAQQASAILFNTVKNGKTDVSELAQGFGGIAPLIADTGISFKSFTAAVSAATSVGTPASQVYSQLKGAISGLTRESEVLDGALKSLSGEWGTQITTFKELVAINKGDVVESFAQIKEQLKGNDAALLKLVGSTEGLAAINTLTSTTYEAYQGALDGTTDAVDNLDEAVQKQQETSGAALDRMKSKITDTAITFGDILAPHIEKAAEAIGRLAEWIGRLNPTQQTWLLGATAVLAALSGTAFVIGKLVTGFGLMLKAMALLKVQNLILAAQWIATHAAMAVATLAAIGPYILLGLAVAGFVILVVKYWDEIVDFLRATWEVIKAIFTPFVNFFKALLISVWEGFKFYFKVITFPIRLAWAALVEIWKIVGPWFKKRWEAVKIVIELYWKIISGVFRAAWATLVRIFTPILGFFRNIWDQVWGKVQSVWAFITTAFRVGVQSIKDIFSRVVDFISAPFKTAFNAVARAWNATVGKISFTVPDWIPDIGGKTFGVPKIPYLERGVRDFEGGLAMVGEAGPELVSLPKGSNVYSNEESSGMAGVTNILLCAGDHKRLRYRR